jgi:hypothetical protein
VNGLGAALAALLMAAPPPATPVLEPRTGVEFAARVGTMSLVGVGLRTKTVFKVKVYAIGFYVADSALSGPLAVHRGKEGTAAFYDDLITGDFDKQFVLKPVRDLSADQVRHAFRSHLGSADGNLIDQFVSYFAATQPGQECVLRWKRGGTLETTVAGRAKPAIVDRAFAEAVFAIWLRPSEDLRRRLVSRAPELLERQARR